MIPVVEENIRLKIALAIPTGAPVMLEKEIINVLPKLKQNKII